MKGQMELDTAFDKEKSMIENMGIMEKFALTQVIDQSTIRNVHEGYGILAETYSSLMAETKSTKKIMDEILKDMPAGSGAMIKDAGCLYDAAIGCATEAVKLAAQAERVINDLYEETPLEQYADAVSGQQDEG
ncbi:MAG: hypothetical protein LUD72_06650 [Bacteroidales bacterium]|nr:hypothetical protein [Bacteroidales bacterium]